MKHFLPLAAVILLGNGQPPVAAQPPTGRSGHHAPTLFGHASIETAWEAAVKQKKPLLVMFTSKRCVYCNKMLQNTYGDPEIQQLLSREVEAVVARAEDYAPLIKKMGIRGYPSTVIVSPQGEVLDLMQGYVEPKKFAERVMPLIKPRLARSTTAIIGPATAER